MFIELADHLRCPAPHEEAYLVLLPDRVEARWVRSGYLGCPICGRTFTLEDGVLDIGGAPLPPAGPGHLDPEALITLAGVQGPGGYLVLVGSAASGWPPAGDPLPGVGLVAVNPGPDPTDHPGVSVLRGGMIPLKANSVRGVALGEGYGSDPHWVGEAARVTLPGLRVVGEGQAPPTHLIELMASAEGVWVGTKARARCLIDTGLRSAPGGAPPRPGGEP